MDIYGLRAQALLPSDFRFVSYNGKLRKEIGTVWRVNSGLLVSSFLSLLSLHRVVSCVYHRSQLLSGNLHKVTSLGNILLAPSGLPVITAGDWCYSYITAAFLLVSLNCIKASVCILCISISSQYSV